MARPRDNADLLSGGKSIEIEDSLHTGLTVTNDEGRKIFEIKEDGVIYQDHEDEDDGFNNGVILVSNAAGIRVIDDGVLEITEDGGETWYTCCTIPEATTVEDARPCNQCTLTFEDAYEASFKISTNGGSYTTGANTSAIIDFNGKLFTCGSVMADSRTGKPSQNYNDVAVILNDYEKSNKSGFKDNFSEIDLTGTLPSDYKAVMVRCVGGYTTTGTQSGMTMVLLENQEIWSIGYNYYGNRGLASASSNQIWEREALNFNWQYIAPSLKSTYGIKDDGTLWVTGRYNYHGINSDYNTFNKVGSDSDWKMIAISHDGQCIYGIKTNGELYSWGDYNTGALGRYAPSSSVGRAITKVGEDSDWIHVSAGGAGDHHFVALKSNGTLWGWGDHGNDNYGYSGRGNDSQTSSLSAGSGPKAAVTRSSPKTGDFIVQIGYDSDWVFCAAGVGTTYAIKEDCSLWTVGNNGFFQIGAGGADRDAYGMALSGDEKRPYANGDRFAFYGHLSSTSTLAEEVTKHRKWLTVCGGYNTALAMDNEDVIFGAGCNSTFFDRHNRNTPIMGTSMGLEVKSQDKFTPIVFGTTDYEEIEKNEPYVPPSQAPTPPPTQLELLPPDYKCTFVSPGWQHPARAGKWPAHIGPDPNSPYYADCIREAQAQCPRYG